MAPLFDHYGVEVWGPELGGAVDPQTAGLEELMILLGILSKREIARARIRVRAAMTVQTRLDVRETMRMLDGHKNHASSASRRCTLT